MRAMAVRLRGFCTYGYCALHVSVVYVYVYACVWCGGGTAVTDLVTEVLLMLTTYMTCGRVVR